MKHHPGADADTDAGEAASPPVTGLAALRDVDPPPSLVAGVMQRLAEPRPPSLWRWLRRPRLIQLRLSPLSAGAVALGLAVIAILALRMPRDGRGQGALASAPAPPAAMPAPPPAAGQRPIRVRFHLQARGARKVVLVGSFNQWTTDGIVLEPVSDGASFAGTVELPPGTHEYMFVVDGRWVTDPAAEERRDDGFGRQNALLRL